MNILAVDDEKLVLESLYDALQEVFPKENIQKEQDAVLAMEYVKQLKANNEELTYAFLDVQLRGTLGIDLAKQIKDVCPNTKIVFCTGYTEYACDAFQLYALGYLLKPVEADKILMTLKKMDIDWKETPRFDPKNIRIQTFGNFEVFINDIRLSFEREKAKELFAYLVDRKGASVTTPEIAALLWEDEPYDRKARSKTTVVISSLKKSLAQAGISELLIKSWNHLAVNTSMFQCDRYDFEKGNAVAVNSYKGEYMANYSWAEFTNGELLDSVYSGR